MSFKGKDTEKVKELLRKLEAMANRGESGERDVARAKLHEIAKKYGVSLDSIGTDEKPSQNQNPDKPDTHFDLTRIFPCRNKEYQLLLAHCIFECIPDAKINELRSPKFSIVVEMEAVTYIKVCEMIKHYWAAYSKEKDAFFRAFIAKNKIGVIPATKTASPKFSNEEILKIRSMANSINATPYKKK